MASDNWRVESMATTTRSNAKRSRGNGGRGRNGPSAAAAGRASGKRRRITRPDDPNANAVPFKVTALAAVVFQPPAISNEIEDKPVFDRSKAQRVTKTKRR